MQRQGVDVVVSLDGVHGVELDVEEEEDESVQSRAQTVTQTSDPCDHPLNHTCRWVETGHVIADRGNTGCSDIASGFISPPPSEKSIVTR